jgi:hypothetical protein
MPLLVSYRQSSAFQAITLTLLLMPGGHRGIRFIAWWVLLFGLIVQGTRQGAEYEAAQRREARRPAADEEAQ